MVSTEAEGRRPEAGGHAAEVWDAVATVVDPEIPVLTIEDLGVLRGVSVEDDGTVVVTITPTYSGCPAMQLIEDQIAITLELEGVDQYRIDTVFSPAWTTDWMSNEAKKKLRSVGIAPPGSPSQAVGRRPKAEGNDRGLDTLDVLCPRCSSDHTRTVSEFGSTACKALMVCDNCQEPFDFFKEL